MRAFVAIVQKNPDVSTVVWFCRRQHATESGPHVHHAKTPNQRKHAADQIIGILRKSLPSFPERLFTCRRSKTSRSVAVLRRRSTSTRCKGEDLAELNTWAPRLLTKLRSLPELRDVKPTSKTGLESSVIIDRDTASRLGIAPQDIDNALYDAFGQRQVSTIYRSLNQYHVVMEVAPEFQRVPMPCRACT